MTNMTDMIEKVARAMCEHDGASWDASSFNDTENGCEPEEQRDYWRDKARVSIEAMRAPTEAMIEAGVTAETGKTLGERVAKAYCAMLDAALNAPQEINSPKANP